MFAFAYQQEGVNKAKAFKSLIPLLAFMQSQRYPVKIVYSNDLIVWDRYDTRQYTINYKIGGEDRELTFVNLMDAYETLKTIKNPISFTLGNVSLWNK